MFVDRNSADGLRNLNTPDDTGVTTITSTSSIIPARWKRRGSESDPAKILAGGNMILTGDRLLNDKVRSSPAVPAIAGLQEVKNDDVAGERRTTDVGSATHYYRIRHKGGDEQGRDRTAYTPPSEIQSISLKPGQLISGGSIEARRSPLTR